MKKLLFLLLLPLWVNAQVSTGREQKFTNGIRNTSSQKILVPDTLVTRGADGTYGHTSAYRLPVSTATQAAIDVKVASNAGLQNAYNFEPVIATSAIKGAVTLKRGSAADTDTVLAVQNGSGTVTASISGDGNIVGGTYNGYTPESTANKSSSYTASSTTTYPNTKALVDGLATKLNGTTTPTATAFTHYFGQTASDGVIRPKTLENVRTEVVTTAAVDAAKPNILTGTGTTNYLPKWTGSNTQGNSNLSDNGSLVSIGVPTTIKGTAGTDSGQLGAELLTTGTSDASWTGTSFSTGYTHVVGSTATLTSGLSAVVNTFYQIAYTVTGRTTGSFTIGFGGHSFSGLTTTGNVGPRATATNSLVITPTTDFNGTIILSIKTISGSSATVSYYNSLGVVTNEIRVSSINTNTFNGYFAGYYNTTGTGNTFYGRNAGYSNTTGNNNAFYGRNAGQSNTTGTDNTFNGVSAGYSNTTGINNTFNGVSAGYSNTTGSYNTFNGLYAGYSNTTGNNNTFNGVSAGQSNTTGTGNTFNGYNAGHSNTTGNNNAFYGRNAGMYVADGTNPNTIANNSLFIGANTKALADNQTNQIVIGYDATGLGSNSTVIGNSSTSFGRWWGNLLVGTSTNNGNAGRFAGTVDVNKLQLNNTPVTATGTPSLLTWNSTTKDVESVPYSTFAPTASPSFTGTPTAPTAAVGTNTTQIATTAFVQSAASSSKFVDLSSPQSIGGTKTFNDGVIVDNLTTQGSVLFNNSSFFVRLEPNTLTANRDIKLPNSSGTLALEETIKPYKVYTALLSQTGTNAPVATVLENTLGGTVVWTRNSAGVYDATLTGAFPANKTAIFLNSFNSRVGASSQVNYVRLGVDSGDGALAQNNAMIEIRVYN